MVDKTVVDRRLHTKMNELKGSRPESGPLSLALIQTVYSEM